MPDSVLKARLRQSESLSRSGAWRLFPTSFDPSDKELTAYARPRTKGWDSVASALRHFKSHGLMMHAPLFWQVEIPLRNACDQAGAFIMIHDVSNMPLGASALQQAQIDMVLATRADAALFSLFLIERKIPLPVFFIVHPLSEGVPALPVTLQGARVAQEVHLFPGVPVLDQCELLMEKGRPLFHVAKDMHAEWLHDHFVLSGAIDDLTPLTQYPLPIALAREALCPCGRETLRTL